MVETARIGSVAEDDRITDAVAQEQGRLRAFIRRRVPDLEEADDILQEVFSEFVGAVRALQPIEQAGAWMFRVARNRIIDRFRRRRPEVSTSQPAGDDADEFTLADLLPSPDAGPDAEYARSVLIDQLEEALDELPDDQRWVFVAHEIEGRSFKELAEESGVSINTLLSRKRYAVLHLRKQLQAIYDEFTGG